MFFICRSFTKLSAFIKATGKSPLPVLPQADSERSITDIAGYFDYMMDVAYADPNVPERAMLPRSGLNKMAILSKSAADCDVLLKAYWTFCGYKRWPPQSSIELIIQSCINNEVPEKAADFFLYHKQLRFSPSSSILNNFFKCLMDRQDWGLILSVFKILYCSKFAKVTEESSLIALHACAQTKNWKWACKFLRHGRPSFSEGFKEAVEEMGSELTEEDKNKFLFGLKNSVS